MKPSYAEQLRDPRWQRKRLEILQRDKFTCQHCDNDEAELHVHHLSYKPRCAPWDYPSGNFITLCTDCHWNCTRILKEVQLLCADSRKKVAFSRLLELLSGPAYNEVTGILIGLANHPAEILKIFNRLKKL